MKKIKVKLTVDLTKYAKGLVAGTEGYTVGNYGELSRAFDRFVTVCFPNIATLDVLWKSLEIIDEEYLKEIEESKKKEEEEFIKELESAYDVVKHVGPLGGFKSLSYRCKNGLSGRSIGFKDKALFAENYFIEHNIPIKTVIQDNNKHTIGF